VCAKEEAPQLLRSFSVQICEAEEAPKAGQKLLSTSRK